MFWYQRLQWVEVKGRSGLEEMEGGGDVWLNDLLYLWLAYRWLRVGNVYRSSGHATVAVVVV